MQGGIDVIQRIRRGGFTDHTLQCAQTALMADIGAFHQRIDLGDPQILGLDHVGDHLLIQQLILTGDTHIGGDDADDAFCLGRGFGDRVCIPVGGVQHVGDAGGIQLREGGGIGGADQVQQGLGLGAVPCAGTDGDGVLLGAVGIGFGEVGIVIVAVDLSAGFHSVDDVAQDLHLLGGDAEIVSGGDGFCDLKGEALLGGADEGVNLDVGAVGSGAAVNGQQAVAGGCGPQGVLGTQNVDEPVGRNGCGGLADHHIGAVAAVCRCQIQQVAVLLVDDPIAAVALLDETPVLSGGGAGRVGDNVGAVEGHVLAGGRVGQSGHEFVAQILGIHSLQIIDFGDVEQLLVAAAGGADLNVGTAGGGAVCYLHPAGFRQDGTEGVVVTAAVDIPALGGAVLIGFGVDIGAVGIHCAFDGDGLIAVLADQAIAAVALVLQAEHPGGGGLVHGADDIIVGGGKVVAGGNVGDLHENILAQINGYFAAGVFHLIDGEQLGFGIIAGIDLHIGQIRGAAAGHIQHAVAGAVGTQHILASVLVQEPALAAGAVAHAQLNIGARGLGVFSGGQAQTVFSVDDLIAAVGLADELPDLCGLFAVGIDDDVGAGKGQVFAGAIADLGVEIVTKVCRFSGFGLFVIARFKEVFVGGHVVCCGADGFLNMGVVGQIVFYIEHGAGFAALIDDMGQKMLIQLIRVGAVGFRQIGIGCGIVIRVKDYVLQLIRSAGGGVAGATDVNDVCIGNGIGLGTDRAAVGGDGGGAGVAFDGIDGAVGVGGDDTDVVGDVGIAAGFEINDITGLGGIAAGGYGGPGIGLALVLEPVQAGGGVGVAGDDGGGDASHMGTPGYEHGAPHILQAVPAAVLRIVGRALDGAG